MPSYVIAIIIAAVLFGIFVLGYLLNKKVPVPEGCEELDEHCFDCKNTLCKFHASEEEKEDKE